jgi:parvulin-like peptidyl-prolyl isomerase
MRLQRIILVTALALGLAGPALAGAVLKVNAVEITPGQLAIAKYKVTDDRPVLTGNDAAVTRAAVELIVANALLADAAREAGISITEKELKKGIASLQASLGGKAAFTDQLRELGASQNELKELAALRMAAQRYVDSVIAPTVAVTEAEARAHYEAPENQITHADQAHIKSIFVNAAPGLSEKEEAAARARIDEAERRVLAGEDFGAVAREMSDDMSKANGGDFGWVESRAIPPKFLGKVWALEPGEMTEVLRGDFGYGILLVVDKRARGPYPFEEMQEQVTGQLRKSKIDAAVASVVATRRAAAKVEGLTPETAAALQP